MTRIPNDDLRSRPFPFLEPEEIGRTRMQAWAYWLWILLFEVTILSYTDPIVSLPGGAAIFYAAVKRY